MKRLSTYALVLAFLPFWACAGASGDDSDNDGSGGSDTGSGGQNASGGSNGSGSTNGSGSSSGSGSSNNSGGNSSSGGSSSNTGGSLSTGGVSTGGVSTGGTASGGTSSGGAGTGGTGTTYEGDCADKPTYAQWYAANDPDTGDTAIFACTKSQGACVGLPNGEDWLFECTASHADNCRSQDPDDAFSWAAIDSCENLGFGGMGGLGGGSP